MSFSPNHRTFRNGKTYSQSSHLKMSVSTESTTDTPGTRDPETVQELINGVSHDFIEESIKANPEPLNEQLSTLTQLLNQLIY